MTAKTSLNLLSFDILRSFLKFLLKSCVIPITADILFTQNKDECLRNTLGAIGLFVAVSQNFYFPQVQYICTISTTSGTRNNVICPFFLNWTEQSERMKVKQGNN